MQKKKVNFVPWQRFWGFLLGCISKFCSYSEYHVHVICAGNCVADVVFVLQSKLQELSAEKNEPCVAFSFFFFFTSLEPEQPGTELL